jgi:hypothetical protein
MTMKLKQLFVALFATSVLFVSCSKDDVFEPIEQTSVVTPESSTVSPQGGINQRMSTSTTVSTPKAYIFIEPKSKYNMVSSYLKTVPKSPSFPLPFIGWFGVNGNAWKYNFLNYVDMPHWYDGRLPSVIETEIPQTDVIDNYNQLIKAYTFKTVKIPKNTAVGLTQISILIPVSQMGNDTKRLRTVYTYEKNPITGALITNGSVSGWTYTMDGTYYSVLFNYQGNRIPKGLYRLYISSALRVNLTSTKDYYLRGNSVVNSN